MNSTRKCRSCFEIKPISEFYNKQYSCKDCYSKKYKIYYQENKDNILKRQKVRYSEKREHIIQKVQEYTIRNYDLLKEKRKQRRITHPEKSRNTQLKSNYGITEKEYREIFERQNGLCAICGCSSKRPLFVDHNHQNGMVRGLLCGRCNSALGYSKENIDVLSKMIDYIKKWSDL